MIKIRNSLVLYITLTLTFTLTQLIQFSIQPFFSIILHYSNQSMVAQMAEQLATDPVDQGSSPRSESYETCFNKNEYCLVS